MSFIRPKHPVKSWISPKTKKGLPSKIHGKGFFAIEPISKDEVVAVKAGYVLDKSQFETVKSKIGGSEIQVADGIFIGPTNEDEVDDSMIYFNHSCGPNIGIGGNILIVAMGDIKAGDELTLDYAMEWADPDLELNCNCGKTFCRQRVTGDDWKNPELQKKYAGYFSWYIEQKIKASHGQTEL